MSDLSYPSLYQINTRVWLTELSRKLGRAATLDDIADADLDHLAAQGFDWVWFLSVWQTGPAAQAISRARPEWRREFAETLPDLTDEDIAGSGFAIQSYTVQRQLGGDAALARLRQRLQQRGLKLMLDFVPNHMAPDHPWIDQHPDYFVPGSETDLARSPQNYCRVQTKNGPLVLAYGRDPYFEGWPDVLQLNAFQPGLRQAAIGTVADIAAQCDGWPDNQSCQNLAAWCWRQAEEHCMIAMNLSPHRSQAMVKLPWLELAGCNWRLHDLLSGESFERSGSEMLQPGMYVELAGWASHFSNSPLPERI